MRTGTGENLAWVDQSLFDYQNWTLNQPDNDGGNENRIQIYKFAKYDYPIWNDRPEDAKMFSICQYDV